AAPLTQCVRSWSPAALDLKLCQRAYERGVDGRDLFVGDLLAQAGDLDGLLRQTMTDGFGEAEAGDVEEVHASPAFWLGARRVPGAARLTCPSSPQIGWSNGNFTSPDPISIDDPL